MTTWQRLKCALYLIHATQETLRLAEYFLADLPESALQNLPWITSDSSAARERDKAAMRPLFPPIKWAAARRIFQLLSIDPGDATEEEIVTRLALVAEHNPLFKLYFSDTEGDPEERRKRLTELAPGIKERWRQYINSRED
jgi:hypothetical protein